MTQQQPPIQGKRKRKVVRRRVNPLKVLRLLLPVMLFIALCVVMCVPTPSSDTSSDPELAVEEAIAQPPVVEIFSGDNVYDLEKLDTVSYYKRHLEKMPEPTQRIKVNYFGNLRPYFNDSNYVH